MSTNDLERRALLGDRQAQEECTAKQILLPCPFCGCRMRLLEGDSYFGSHLVKCVWCGAGTREVGNKYVAIYLANRRPAPPIGRCKDCAHKQKAKVNDKGFLVCPASGMEITDDDFCGYFEEVPDEAAHIHRD